MDKFEFITELRAKLWALPEEDKQRSVDYYREMIDDRMEDGLSEEEAVAAVGNLNEIVENILAETPAAEPEKPAVKQKRKLTWWEIVLLVLGSPVWGALLIAVVAVVFSVCASLWAVVISLYATAVALGASSIGCFVGSFFMIGSIGEGMVAWGAALLCAGLAILFVMLSNLAAKGMIALTKWICSGIFRRKERAV